MAVHRVRPKCDDDDDCYHSSDVASDEELTLQKEDLKDALTSRIGGKFRILPDDTCTKDQEEDDQLDHYENSSAGMTLAQAVWETGECGRQRPVCTADCDLEQVLAAARASQRKEKSLSSSVKFAEEKETSLQELTSATVADVKMWLTGIKSKTGHDGRLYLNTKQYEMVSIVAERVMAELDENANHEERTSEPLRWLLHGGPGTGKSHVIKVIKKDLFEQVLHWDMGVQFQIVALQAVMAEILGGDTIHHALGIPAFKRGTAPSEDFQRHMDVAKKVLQWRWLIIDEISMVGAKLLAVLDMKLREVIRDIGTAKKKQWYNTTFWWLKCVVLWRFLAT